MTMDTRKTLDSANGSQRPILVFVSIAYALSIGLSLLIGLTGGHRSRWIGLVSMLVPVASVLATNSVVRDSQGTVGWDRLPLRYLPAALFLMPVVLHAAMLPAAAALDRLHWQRWLTPGADGLYHVPADRGWGVLTPAGLAARMALDAVAD